MSNNQPVTTTAPTSTQQEIPHQQQQEEQSSLSQQETTPHADVGPNMPRRSNTGGNQIPTDSELEQQQQQQQQGNNTEAQTNNNLSFPVVPKGQQQQTEDFPVEPKRPLQMHQQAPKPKVDHTQTDATIQGLLVQVIALQHNKIQQIAASQQEQ